VTADIDYADVQGTILRGYRADLARHFVLRVVDPAAARRFLGALVAGDDSRLPQITTAARWTVKPKCFLNLGITAAGLTELGVPAPVLGTFPAAFLRGATDPVTCTLVGDVGPSDPSNWTHGFGDGAGVHLLLSLWAAGGRAVIEEISGVLRAGFAGALEELGAHDASALADNKVHFGYTDNISQPTVEGAPPTKRPRPDHQPVAPTGEFLLGYTNQYGASYTVGQAELSTNSSFAAFRVLDQDVAGFEAFLVDYSTKAGIDVETLAAKVCGRWRNGVPLVLSPETPTPDPPVPRHQINDYDYVSTDAAQDDTLGYRCPIGSHMRRANPRSEKVVGGGQHLHRIVRRAMPYGPPYDPSEPAMVERGLIGYFINADLTNQFEFLMSQWVNRSDFVMSATGPAPSKGANAVKNISGQDVVLGVNDPGDSSFTLSSPGSGTTPWSNQALTGFSRYITTRGGAYCYLPSITAVRYLAGL
jgi:Dyp-type peroxidase family